MERDLEIIKDIKRIQNDLNKNKNRIKDDSIKRKFINVSQQLTQLICDIESKAKNSCNVNNKITSKSEINRQSNNKKNSGNSLKTSNTKKVINKTNKSTTPKKTKSVPVKNNQIHLAHKGRNASRVSSLYNPQGGFKFGSGYHIKEYED
ncbi:hypothetical protein CEF21_05415 [Bacillus sp. FJAT-42376]|uniref:hypothetical protein n=1 Tax=Bacillus sp. FJAT-42376 TaxID=2014076 RepID=UPI000F4D335B|nr:hypothetical protein [Bacillus sp. FJAT-42376]AZB41787.1 hypothetical protein CEF21_05415 [Bacillus sp. FJAT-42376]